MIARVYATVSRADYETFRLRAKAEGMTPEEAFAKLVTYYNHGGELRIEHRKAHAKGQGADYLRGRT